MAILSKIIGKAVAADTQEIKEQLQSVLIEQEIVHLAFKVVRDMVVFTNRRIMFVDFQGLTGKKTEYLSIPYKSISHFSVETAGHADLDFDLKLWIKSRPKVMEKKLRRNKKLAKEVIKLLTRYTT